MKDQRTPAGDLHGLSSSFARSAIIASIVTWYIASSTPFLQIAQAQESGVAPGETGSTNPKDRSAKVTATVADRIPPSIPILVSPENNSLLSQNIFAFIWKESTDDYGIQKYQLFLDGSVWMDNAGPGTESTSDYTVTASSGTLTLLPKKSVADGTHTWKIRAFDNNGNYTDSATWSFTVDTQAPTLLVTSLGGVTLSVSSKDSSTIPTTPVILQKNEPVLTGTSEANIVIKLFLTIPGRDNYTAQTNTNSSGNYSFTLPILPLGQTIEIQLQAQDTAGNTSIIDKLPFRIELATAKPIATAKPGIPATPIPLPTLPPLEEVRPAYRLAIEEFFASSLHLAPGQVQMIERTFVRPISNYLFGLILPVTHVSIAIWLTHLSLWQLSPRRIWNILKSTVLLLLPPPEDKDMGIVFDAKTGKRVPYAVVRIHRLSGQNQQLSKQVAEHITDAYGRYPAILVAQDGAYILEIQQREYETNTSIQEAYRDNSSYYVGQILTKENCTVVSKDGVKALSFCFLVPTLAKNPESSSAKASSQVAMYATTPTVIWIVSSLFLSALAVWALTPWNIGMAILYWVGTARHLFQKEPKTVHTSQ